MDSPERHQLHPFAAQLYRSLAELGSAHEQEGELRLLVAVSGGKDSHALLHALCGLRRSFHLHVSVAHFDHALRAESVQDACFVEELAKKYQCPFFLQRAEEGPGSENLEAWARRERYRFLEVTRVLTRSEFILTAHHQADQAETVLMRLINGRMLTDARGIAEYKVEKHIFRPLLQVKKEDLDSYVSEFQIPFVFDESNDDLARTRNLVRKKLLPLLKSEFNPQVVPHLAMFASRSAEDEACLFAYVREKQRQHSGSWSVADLLRLEPALRWRMLSVLGAEQVGDRAKALGYWTYQMLAHELQRSSGELREYHLGFQIQCEVSTGAGVRFYLHTEVARTEPLVLKPETLRVPGFVQRRYENGATAVIHATVLDASKIQGVDKSQLVNWAKSQALQSSVESGAVAYFDFDALGRNTLTVRERQHGDSIRVWERGGRKLKKLFLERAVALETRDSVPLVELDEEIIWIPGVARNGLAPIRTDSRSLLELRYVRSASHQAAL